MPNGLPVNLDDTVRVRGLANARPLVVVGLHDNYLTCRGADGYPAGFGIVVPRSNLEIACSQLQFDGSTRWIQCP